MWHNVTSFRYVLALIYVQLIRGVKDFETLIKNTHEMGME